MDNKDMTEFLKVIVIKKSIEDLKIDKEEFLDSIITKTRSAISKLTLELDIEDKVYTDTEDFPELREEDTTSEETLIVSMVSSFLDLKNTFQAELLGLDVYDILKPILDKANRRAKIGATIMFGNMFEGISTNRSELFESFHIN